LIIQIHQLKVISSSKAENLHVHCLQTYKHGNENEQIILRWQKWLSCGISPI